MQPLYRLASSFLLYLAPGESLPPPLFGMHAGLYTPFLPFPIHLSNTSSLRSGRSTFPSPWIYWPSRGALWRRRRRRRRSREGGCSIYRMHGGGRRGKKGGSGKGEGGEVRKGIHQYSQAKQPIRERRCLKYQVSFFMSECLENPSSVSLGRRKEAIKAPPLPSP